MAPRWKGKAAEAKSLAEPMSEMVSRLQSSLIESNSQALISGCSILVAANPEQTELFNHACFGRPIITADNDKQWFQLSFEEALYLCTVMKCIKIVAENKCVKSDEELWRYMKSKRADFPILYKAYSHLRRKNWVVRAGSQYGVDFVAYRHHPALVHSEYAVLALSGDDGGNTNARLKVWSDYHCTLRLCGSVAKTLLVLHISKNGDDAVSLSSLEDYCVEERIVTRWNPERSGISMKMPDSSEELKKNHANSGHQVREDSEYVRLVIPNEPRKPEANILESQTPEGKRSPVWWMKAIVGCSITIIVLLIFVKWGVPFLYTRFFFQSCNGKPLHLVVQYSRLYL